MKLYHAPPSPFSRKVRIAASVLKLGGEIALVPTDTLDPADPIREKNPLGKIPMLETDEGEYIYDSAVIAAWLDERAGGGLIIPRDPKARFRALVLESLADGLTDAAVLTIYETRFREPSERSAKWLSHQGGKIERALAQLEQSPPVLEGTPDIGQIALACALGYLDLRFSGAWRATHPHLVDWLVTFAQRVPAFAITAPA
ncbi:glutathione S-transferase [Rhodoblastus sphagnicola]|uniref:Glutathione S-transferase n=1 Tax=Rhodoblastus sphagnicola TaxID=333368 RepID=A0A2S6N312_9HYPH|nr:glutathione S-transferase family protein [Rhodoblastus sphagnicola]MBB4199126.1 glutathione S-transferase [Rhodoblastus sphagnicola]PPQ29015.1 glutathione S-transferase [Rhodoblastus sphagnicola]